MIRMQRAALTLAAVLALGGCDPEPPMPPDPAVNRPGPQADPGQCNSRGKREVEVQAHWVSENDRPPKVMWTHNGVGTPATNLRSYHSGNPGGAYTGEWSRLIVANCHDTITVSMEQAPGQMTGICAIVDLGQGPVKQGKSCRAEYTVP